MDSANVARIITEVTEEQSAQYQIIRGVDMFDLSAAVNAAMNDGWVPLGGPLHVAPNPMESMETMTGGKMPHPFWQALTRA